jgi:hypothetical protein
MGPVCLVHLVSLVREVQLNKRDKPNKPEQPTGSRAPRFMGTETPMANRF